MNRTVVFVCPHGVAKSRLAAAVFNQVAPGGWQATSAGLQPQEEMSTPTMALVAGTNLDGWLDRQPPRPVPDAPAMAMLISIDCDLPGAVRWDLAHAQVGAAMLDELRQRVEALSRQVEDAGR